MQIRTKLAFGIALALGIVAASSASADEKSHRRAAEELLKVMGMEKQLQSALDQTLDVQVKANPQIAPFKDAMGRFLSKHMSWAGLKEDLITIYADAFDEEELDQIRKFYLTPAGKKLSEKSTELMSKGMQLGLKRVQDNQAELREMIQEEAKKQQ